MIFILKYTTFKNIALTELLSMERKMTREDPKIAFYNGSAVHTVLKRYEFTDDEKEMIHLAILAAKKEKPDMKFIDKADALLRMVSSSREPTKETEDPIKRVKNLARLDANYSLKTAKLKYDWKVNPVSLMLLGMVVIVFLTVQFTKYQQANWYIEDHGVHTYNKAKKICKSNWDILPTVAQMNEVYEQSNIFIRIAEYFSNKSYWVDVDNKPMVYKIRDDEAIEVTPDNLYEVRCLNSANSVFY